MPKTTTPIHLVVSPAAMDFIVMVEQAIPPAAGPLNYMIDRIADGNIERLLEKTEPVVAEFEDIREFERGPIRFTLKVGDVEADGTATVLLITVEVVLTIDQ